MTVVLNGDPHRADGPISLADAVALLTSAPAGVARRRQRRGGQAGPPGRRRSWPTATSSRSLYPPCRELRWTTRFVIAGESFSSRLIHGPPAAAPSLDGLERALAASGTELTTWPCAGSTRPPWPARAALTCWQRGGIRVAAPTRQLATNGRRGGPLGQARPQSARDPLGQARGHRRRAHAAARPAELLTAAEQLIADDFVVLPYTQ